ncbi:PP2C family protein-serine/threonine phosphatase [Nocardioides terrisoli]|uniref:PP2C family protein-serine/threonine phosphatase n=1 Tax=Nocardioides terrisoli TaxID=3388267 RepID=UPI00287B9B66|nr:protein phosphatase 2C domain-containing protein [Nocardioides marmorisolisilvae]
MRLALRFTALSDVGRVRRDNQDSGYAGPHLLAVADGVGGAARGDVASATTIQQIRELDRPPGNDATEQLVSAVHRAHTRLADLVADNPELDGTSTTATVALFDGAQVILAHVGDSRAYLLHEGELRQLTKDHTFVQSLVDEGRITDDEARVHPHRNLILRAVDGVREPEPDVFTVPLAPGDRILVCSDGCCGSLTDEELAGLLATDPLDRAAPALVNAALEAGSSDNVTVVVAEVVDEDQHTDAAEPDAAEPDAAESASPIVVGAAAGTVRTGLRGSLRRRRQEPEPPTDPEALRYAPLPPRRSPWARRLAVLALVVVVLVVAAILGYRWTQSQYYVGAQGSHVAIYQGIDMEVPGVTLRHLVTTEPLELRALGEYDGALVRGGITRSSLSSAQEKVRELVANHCKPVPKQLTKAEKTALKKAQRKARKHHRPVPKRPMVPPAGCPGSA